MCILYGGSVVGTEEQQQLHNPDEIDQLSTLIDILLFAPRESTASLFFFRFVLWWKLEPKTKKHKKKWTPSSLDSLFFSIYPQKEVDGNGSTGRNDYLCLKSGEQHDITQLAAASFQKSLQEKKPKIV